MLNAEALEGVKLGKYLFDEKVGQGGMAFVYKAHQAGLDNTVAIKILFPELVRKGDIANRFRREAKLQSRLRHVGLVRALDLIDEQGILGMVMEWVEGQDLSDYLEQRSKPLENDDLNRLFLPILECVGFAHKHGVVHRDLKPANILVEGAVGHESVRLMDFGIAKTEDNGGLQVDGVQTKTGMVMGTALYLAPESLSSRKVDHRIDVYALGITLFELMTLRPPFINENLMMLMTEHCTKEPPAPSSFNPLLDEAVEAVILRAIEKDPNARFQSCEDFAEALKTAIKPKQLPFSGTLLYNDEGDDKSLALGYAETMVPPENAPPPDSSNAETVVPDNLQTAYPNDSDEFDGIDFQGRQRRISVVLGLLAALMLPVTWWLWGAASQKPQALPLAANVGALTKAPRPEKRTPAVTHAPTKIATEVKKPTLPKVRKVVHQRPKSHAKITRPKRKTRRRRRVSSARRTRPQTRRRSTRCDPQANKETCRRCVTLWFRAKRGASAVMAGRFGGSCTWRDYLAAANACHQKCGCQFPLYADAFLLQRFRASHQGTKPRQARAIPRCRELLLEKSFLHKLQKRYRQTATLSLAKQALQ